MTDELAEMDWNKQDQQHLNCSAGGAGPYVTVMTDEQVELLRRQISVYTTICEQLLEMHKAVTAQQDFSVTSVGLKRAELSEALSYIAGLRLGNLYCDTLMASAGHKITARHRWTPTSTQLQILERLFDQGNGTPSKQALKEITSELSQHGLISETNVYNWFQNRRARSKRKQLTGVTKNVESEAEAEVESPTEMKTKPEDIELLEKPASAQNLYIQSPELSTEMHCFGIQPNNGEPIFPPDHGLRQFGSFSSL